MIDREELKRLFDSTAKAINDFSKNLQEAEKDLSAIKIKPPRREDAGEGAGLWKK